MTASKIRRHPYHACKRHPRTISEKQLCRPSLHNPASFCQLSLQWLAAENSCSLLWARQRFLHIFLLAAFTAICVQEAECQVSAQGSAFNPFMGQGTMPDGYTPQNFTVFVSYGVRRLFVVDELSDSFSALFSSHLEWTDTRALDLMMAPYETCGFYCSSQPALVLNVDGEPACCDGVFIPTAESRNVKAYNSQGVPFIYNTFPLPDGKIVYATLSSGTWHYHFDYSAYPWDTHYLAVEVETGFRPVIRQTEPDGSYFFVFGGSVVESQKSGSEFEPGSPRAITPVVSVPGWELGRTWMEVLNLTQGYEIQVSEHTSVTTLVETSSLGFRIYIKISRISWIFYSTVVILPTALIIIFSFVIFSLGRSQFKARISILLLLFLSLVLLQYILSSILPGTYSLLSPVYLILVSYIYNFLLLFISIVSYAIFIQHNRRRKKQFRDKYRDAFKRWTAAVEQSAEQAPPADVETPEEGPGSAEALLEVGAPEGASRRDGLIRRQKHTKAGFGGPASAEGEGSEQAVDNIDEQTWVWFTGVQQRWYVKCFPFTRELMVWYRFVGQENSRAYLDSLSHQLESWTRAFLFLAYLVSVGLIFGFARGRVDEAAASHSLLGGR